MNDNGEYFPLWGTCQGFEYLAMFAADEGADVLSLLGSHGVSIPLQFVGDPLDTRMFHDAGDKAMLFASTPSSYMSHSYGLAPAKFTTDAGLAKMFTMTATSTDCMTEATFVSSMESPDYPFQGVQFHPEKQVY